MKKDIIVILMLSLVGCSSGSKGTYTNSKTLPGSIDHAIESHSDQFQECQKREVKFKAPNEPLPTGKVEVSFSINPEGVVTQTSVISSSINSRRVEKCIQDVLSRIKFSKNADKRVIQMTYPFVFNSAEEVKQTN